MFRVFRRHIEAIEALTTALGTAASQLADTESPSLIDNGHGERIEGLELSRAKWEAECEATLLRADGKLKAANNAEARARTMKKSYEGFFDDRDEDSPEGEEEGRLLPPGNGEVVDPEPLQPVQPVLEISGKERATRMKWL